MSSKLIRTRLYLNTLFNNRARMQYTAPTNSVNFLGQQILALFLKILFCRFLPSYYRLFASMAEHERASCPFHNCPTEFSSPMLIYDQIKIRSMQRIAKKLVHS